MKFITDPEEWAAKCIDDPEWLGNCLLRINRFGGQLGDLHVLGHSMEVSLCMEGYHSQLWGLLHDAHESVSGDVTRKFKAKETTQRQWTFDNHLTAELKERNVTLFDNYPAVAREDLRIGLMELENPQLYAEYYSRRSVTDFADRFQYLFNKCVNHDQ